MYQKSPMDSSFKHLNETRPLGGYIAQMGLNFLAWFRMSIILKISLIQLFSG